jgi:hypothetical protein
MVTRQLEVVAEEGPAMFHVFGEDVGEGAPERPWCSDYAEVE